MAKVDLNKIPVFGARTPFFPKVPFNAKVALLRFRYVDNMGESSYFIECKVLESNHPEVKLGEEHAIRFGGDSKEGRQAAFGRMVELLTMLFPGRDANTVQDILLQATEAGKDLTPLTWNITQTVDAAKNKDKTLKVNLDGTPKTFGNQKYYISKAA